MRPAPLETQPTHHRGFTLIELLVAISIFVILLALTIGTLQSTQTEDKVRETSRVTQAYFEGARSRAFREEKAVGVRLLLDPDDMTIATGMIYIAERNPVRGQLEFVSYDAGSDTTLIRQARSVVVSRRDRLWSRLARRGELQPASPSVKMQIPPRSEGSNSRTYFLASDGFANLVGGTPSQMRIVGEYHQDPLPTREVEYELFLAPQIFPGADVTPLPKGAVIDLRSSYNNLPPAWQDVLDAVKGEWQANTPYNAGDWVRSSNGELYYQAIQGGTSDTGASPFTGNEPFGSTVTDDTVVWQVFDSPHFDIMFSPRGSVIGREAAAGIISLVVTDRDAIFSESTGRRLVLIADADSTTDNGLTFVGDNEGKYRIINIFTQSGTITTSLPDFTDTSPADNIPDNLFNYAVNGSEAK